MNTVLVPVGLPVYSRPTSTLLSPTTPPPQPRHLRSFTLDLCSWPQARGLAFDARQREQFPHGSWRGLRTALAGSPVGVAESGLRCVMFRHVTLLRTGCSPPAASHPVLPRRSSLRYSGRTFRLTGLPPRSVGAFTGARARRSRRFNVGVYAALEKSCGTGLFCAEAA